MRTGAAVQHLHRLWPKHPMRVHWRKLRHGKKQWIPISASTVKRGKSVDSGLLRQIEFIGYLPHLTNNGEGAIETRCEFERSAMGDCHSWDSNSETKFRTEPRELRSSGMTTISESGNSATIRALVSSAALMLRAGRTSLAPRMAKTRAVSAPIPDVAPGNQTEKKNKKTFYINHRLFCKKE